MAGTSTAQSHRVVPDTTKTSLRSRLSFSPTKHVDKASNVRSDARLAGRSEISTGASHSDQSKLGPQATHQTPSTTHFDFDQEMGRVDGSRRTQQSDTVTSALRNVPGAESTRHRQENTAVILDPVRQQQNGHLPNTSTSPPLSAQPNSPPRTRQPIYPALASPPRDRPPRSVPGASVSPARSPPERRRPEVGILNPSGSDQSVQHALYPSSPPRVNGAHPPKPSPPISHSGRSATMQIIASSGRQQDLNMVHERTGQRLDKQGRPLMSARRSATSSSRTITRRDSTSKSTTKSSIPSPTYFDSSDADPSALQQDHGLTEASAYARAITTHLVRPDLEDGPHRAKSADVVSPPSSKAHGLRPLPRPPNAVSDSATIPHRAPTVSQPSAPQLERLSVSSRSPETRPQPSNLDKPQAIDFDFPRSPTIPALTDPRQKPPHDSVQGHTLPTQPVGGQAVATTIDSKIRPGIQGAHFKHVRRPPGKLTLRHLLSHPRIQSALLSTISINAFLSLTGSTEIIRRQFTGESVGRWVLQEWGVHTPSPFGVRWPNLTVWEGFLESLLHDPATYSTYPLRWHNLLRHLSLSHSLVILFLRNLPSSCFPNHSLLPFEDEGPSVASLPYSPSSTSLASMGQPRSRVGSVAGSDTGSIAPSGRPPRRERIVEIVMPEPLAAQPQEELITTDVNVKPVRRRGSISSLASAASFSFGRRRSNSNALDVRPASRLNGIAPLAEPTASMAPGKGAPPPVSYPLAKRYGFKGPNDGLPRSRSSSMAPRPGSIFSMQTSPSVSSHGPRMSLGLDARSPHVPVMPLNSLPVPPPLSVKPRSSFGSADSHRRSDREQSSPIPGRRAAFPFATPTRCEPAFDRPMPYIPGRVPVLRVFVPLSEAVRRWPSAEGATAAVEELEKCGALKRMQLGDLVVNTAIRQPRTTEHVLVFVPSVKHLLVPLQYLHASTGHLPSYVDAFALPPSYYYPFLPAPQIIYLNLGPYRDQGLRSMRLASDRRDMTIASGAKISAKRYLYVAGVEITANDKAATEWQGMVSLEAEGTAEGKSELENRFGPGKGRKAPLAPWEIIKEKSMGGTVWLRLVKDKAA